MRPRQHAYCGHGPSGQLRAYADYSDLEDTSRDSGRASGASNGGDLLLALLAMGSTPAFPVSA